MLYNHSTTDDTDRLLRYYISEKKLVELIPWHSIPTPDPGLDYFKRFEALSKYGQIIAHNHCLLSLIGRARHVILVDIDEFIIPKAWNSQDTLKNSIPRLIDAKSEGKTKIGGFQVRSAFVNMTFPEFANISQVDVDRLALPKMFQPFKHFDIQKPGQRCKMILKPEATDKMTVHRPFQYLMKFREVMLEPGEALIYHLRDKKLPGKEEDVAVDPFGPMKEPIFESIKHSIKSIQKSEKGK